MKRKQINPFLFTVILTFIFGIACKRTHIDDASTFFTPIPSLETSEIANGHSQVTIISQTEADLLSLPQLKRFPSISQLNSAVMPFVLESLVINPLSFDRFSNSASIHHLDVNSDGLVDLVIHEELLLVVLLWNQGQYGEPFIYYHPTDKYGSLSRITFADWTSDETPEIIYDYLGHTGGTGLSSRLWERVIIHCRETCSEVWNEVTEQFNRSEIIPGIYGFNMLQSELVRQTNQTGQPVIEMTTQAFTFDTSVDGLGEPYAHIKPSFIGLSVLTPTLSVFEWNSESFTLRSQSAISGSYKIDSNTSLTTKSSSNPTITVAILTDYNMNTQLCQLQVGEQKIHTAFACNPRFTTVNWDNVISDQADQLIVSTIASPGAFEILGLDVEEGKNCVYKKLMIYRQTEDTLQEIANVTGCIINSELYGVRMLDIDRDGLQEIMAASSWFDHPVCYYAGCWFELDYHNVIYKWNGSEYSSN